MYLALSAFFLLNLLARVLHGVFFSLYYSRFHPVNDNRQHKPESDVTLNFSPSDFLGPT